jgi:hypothetical protein
VWPPRLSSHRSLIEDDRAAELVVEVHTAGGGTGVVVTTITETYLVTPGAIESFAHRS